MKANLLLAGSFVACFSAYSLPVYDNFSTYGIPGVWAEVAGPPILSSSTGPQLGGTTAPSRESWIAYTNVPASLLSTIDGASNQNVCVVNYFADGQPGATDTAAPNLPANFPGPFVSGLDTRTNSIWTPGWAQSGNLTVTNYLGGVGACLQFASDVPGTTGNKVFVSFFADVPDCTGSFGAGQSLDHGYTAGFINSAELPSPNSGVNQNVLPGYAGYTPAPLLFEKFNMRAVSASTWRPGVGYLDSNANSDNATGAALTQKTIHFIVMSYEFKGGATLDTVNVWLDPTPASFGAATELTIVNSGNGISTSPTAGNNLPDVGGFFFLANTQDGGGTPNSGVIFNSLSIGTNWAYVTGGPQFTSYAPASTNIAAGQTLVLNSTAAAGGGVPAVYAWQTNNGVNSGPLIVGGRFSVSPTGALTIANVQPGDAGTYTLQVSTAITTENSVAPSTAQSVVTVTSGPAVFTSESVAGSSQFQLNFTGPAGSAYRIWRTANPLLSPVTNTWVQFTNGTFAGGTNTVTDTSATDAARFYVITVP